MSKKILDVINSLVDEKSFIELNGSIVSKPLNPNNISREEKGDGVLTGYCRINDNLVFVFGQDESVLNGSLSEMQSKKISNLYDKAISVGAPIIGIYDNSGFRLSEGITGMYSIGSILNAQENASGVIPQISIVLNNCGGISSLLAKNSDFLFIEEKANMFLLPTSVTEETDAKALTEEGVCDFCGSESEIINKIHELLSFIPQNCYNEEMYVETTDDLNRQTLNISSKETKGIITDIADNNIYYEINPSFAPPATSGFIKLNGQTIGVCGMNKPDKVCSHALHKMTKLLRFCNSFRIPILMIANATNFHACENSGGPIELIKSVSRFAKCYTSCDVPKVTLVKDAYGVPGMIMGAKSLGSDVVFAFENSKTGMMDEKALVEMQYESELKNVSDKNDFINKKIDEIKNRDSVYQLAGSGYIDDVIDEVQARQLLVSAFEMLYTKN